MLEDVIKTKKVKGKLVSILLYSIDKEDRLDEPRLNHYYEVRISNNDKLDTFEIYADYLLIKRKAIKLFNEACIEVEIDYIKEQANLEKIKELNQPITVVDSVTGKTFAFANSYDKNKFFDTWDKLVVDVLDREDE